uniref:Uncharacterized protein n=1 Tax=Arundo donax TaxID=35708 RepID=A0A0A9D1V7_ARUDO
MGSVALEKWETNQGWGGQLHSLFVYFVQRFKSRLSLLSGVAKSHAIADSGGCSLNYPTSGYQKNFNFMQQFIQSSKYQNGVNSCTKFKTANNCVVHATVTICYVVRTSCITCQFKYVSKTKYIINGGFITFNKMLTIACKSLWLLEG